MQERLRDLTHLLAFLKLAERNWFSLENGRLNTLPGKMPVREIEILAMR